MPFTWTHGSHPLHGIYVIENQVTQKVYVGQSCGAGGIRGRWRQHLSALRKGNHSNIKLQRAWAKYGEAAFLFRVVEVVECLDQVILDRLEVSYIALHNSFTSGYNMTSGGNAGTVASDETKRRISLSRLGKKTGPLSLEHRRAIADGLRASPNLCRARTAEQQAALRVLALGLKRSAETRQKQSEALTGRVLDTQWREKLSRAQAGKRLSAETRAKMSQVRVGKTRTPDSIEKSAQAHRGTKRSPETCRRISEARLRRSMFWGS